MWCVEVVSVPVSSEEANCVWGLGLYPGSWSTSEGFTVFVCNHSSESQWGPNGNMWLWNEPLKFHIHCSFFLRIAYCDIPSHFLSPYAGIKYLSWTSLFFFLCPRLLCMFYDLAANDWPTDPGAQHVHDQPACEGSPGGQFLLWGRSQCSSALRARPLCWPGWADAFKPAPFSWAHHIWPNCGPVQPGGQSMHCF